MVPSHEQTALALSVFAAATKTLLVNPNTPKIFRDKLARLAAELREGLMEEMGYLVDAAEAEATILAYAESLPLNPADTDLLSQRQTLHALESKQEESAR